MIRYALKCRSGHVFESWFRNSAAYELLVAEDRVACAVCGEGGIEKTVMAPALGSETNAAAEQQPLALDRPASPTEQALRKLRRHLASNADYVGGRFADEARRIHVGESDKRAIWGEATLEDAKALHEEGVPVAPLPRLIRRDD